VSREAKQLLAEKGFDPVFGARPLKRTIQRYLEDPLSEEIISGRLKDKKVVKVGRKNEELTFE
jgi:ATP-dependent Clp protease ATP-binding subunit ClpA